MQRLYRSGAAGLPVQGPGSGSCRACGSGAGSRGWDGHSVLFMERLNTNTGKNPSRLQAPLTTYFAQASRSRAAGPGTDLLQSIRHNPLQTNAVSSCISLGGRRHRATCRKPGSRLAPASWLHERLSAQCRSCNTISASSESVRAGLTLTAGKSCSSPGLTRIWVQTGFDGSAPSSCRRPSSWSLPVPPSNTNRCRGLADTCARTRVVSSAITWARASAEPPDSGTSITDRRSGPELPCRTSETNAGARIETGNVRAFRLPAGGASVCTARRTRRPSSPSRPGSRSRRCPRQIHHRLVCVTCSRTSRSSHRPSHAAPPAFSTPSIPTTIVASSVRVQTLFARIGQQQRVVTRRSAAGSRLPSSMSSYQAAGIRTRDRQGAPASSLMIVPVAPAVADASRRPTLLTGDREGLVRLGHRVALDRHREGLAGLRRPRMELAGQRLAV